MSRERSRGARVAEVGAQSDVDYLPMSNDTAMRALLFIALVATALALVGAFAHAFSLANKISLPAEQYFIVQQAYAGWDRFAYVLGVQLVSLIGLAVVARHEARLLWPAVMALACLVAAQGVFWTFTYPANAATANWTAIPDNWATLRSQWEYSHLAGAVLQLAGFCTLCFAAVTMR